MNQHIRTKNGLLAKHRIKTEETVISQRAFVFYSSHSSLPYPYCLQLTIIGLEILNIQPLFPSHIRNMIFSSLTTKFLSRTSTSVITAYRRNFHASSSCLAKLNVEGLAKKVDLDGKNVLVRVDLNVPLAKVCSSTNLKCKMLYLCTFNG